MNDAKRSLMSQYIHTAHNLGSAQFYEHPLFLIGSSKVFRIYLSDGEITIDSYLADTFKKNAKNGIFRDPDHPDQFDYFYPKGTAIESTITSVHIKTNTRPYEVALKLLNGKTIVLKESNLVPGTMDTYIE